ncbi:uncharacterized protein [Mobula birostris]|uniref:uncharacterized protein n=1 Tax=Mobula birostris TaxID=1983395 RepID=UPI003B27F041
MSGSLPPPPVPLDNTPGRGCSLAGASLCVAASRISGDRRTALHSLSAGAFTVLARANGGGRSQDPAGVHRLGSDHRHGASESPQLVNGSPSRSEDEALPGCAAFVGGSQADGCGTPPALENGAYSVSSYKIGSWTYYTCNEGYILYGRNRKLCTQNGWTRGDMSCQSPVTVYRGAENMEPLSVPDPSNSLDEKWDPSSIQKHEMKGTSGRATVSVTSIGIMVAGIIIAAVTTTVAISLAVNRCMKQGSYNIQK